MLVNISSLSDAGGAKVKCDRRILLHKQYDRLDAYIVLLQKRLVFTIPPITFW